MRFKRNLLIFLGIFIFIMVPKNVFAETIYPYSVSINNTAFSDWGISRDVRITQSIGANSSFTLNLAVESFDYAPQYLDYSFNKFPNIFLFFKTANLESEIGLSKQTTCNQSCFAQDGIFIKKVGTDAVSGHNIYILVLKAKKWTTDCGVGSGQCVYHIDDVLTITNNRTNARGFIFYNVLLSDNLDILNNNVVDIDAMISNASSNSRDIMNNQTSNTNSIINNQNSNTQNIINNQNTNSNNIINNQNTNQQQTHQDLGNINSSINNDSVSSNNDNQNKANEWSSSNLNDAPVSQLLLMPINFLNAFQSGFNSTCQPYNLGSFYGTNLVLPCINVSNYLGSSLWNTIDIIVCALLSFAIGKKIVRVFNDFTNLRDNQVDDLYGGGK